MRISRTPLKLISRSGSFPGFSSRLPVCLLALCLCLPLFGRTEAAGEASPFAYNAAAETYTAAGRSWTNLFEYASSPNGDYLIYITSQINQDPAVWLYHRSKDTLRRLTGSDPAHRSQARVDNNGNWAIVQGISSAAIIYNGSVLKNDGVQFHSLCFHNGKLFFASWDPNAKTTALFLYDPETQTTETLAAGLSLSSGLSASAGDTILLEAYDIAASANVVLAVRPEAEESARVRTLSGEDSFLLPSDGEPRILRLSGDDNTKYLFNACYWLNKYQSGEPWSGSPDSTGRVSWNESYRLLGMEELWEKTENETIRSTISAAVRRLISTRETAYQSSGLERDRFLFVTRIYSLDKKTELRAIVNNAMVYWPILRAANSGCLEEETRQTLLSMAESAFQYYEADWDPASGCYRSPKGAPVQSDGSVIPFNQQNAFGLCLIELWRATGNPVYRERCAVLAQTFAKELELTADGRTIWHYWPQEYYNGWTEADGVSQNTPNRKMTENPPYEDASHAALNAAFILEYSNVFGDVFSSAQVQGLRRTLDAVYTDEGTSQTLEPAEITNRYHNGLWAALLEGGERENAFARQFRKTDIFSTLEFDSQSHLYASARLYDPAAGGRLRASILLYADGSLRLLEKRAVPLENIPAFAKRCFSTIPTL